MENAVVMVVDKYSIGAHLARLTAGVKYPADYSRKSRNVYYTKEFYSILVDLANIRKGTRVFFYKRRIDEPPDERGFMGEWEAIPLPDTETVAYEDLSNDLYGDGCVIHARCPQCGCPKSSLSEGKPVCAACKQYLQGHILPLRSQLQQVHIYSNYLDDNTAYVDITDNGRLSTLIFRKIYGAGRERSVNPILPEETTKLRRLLQRVQDQKQNELVPVPCTAPCFPSLSNIKSISFYLDFSQKYPIKRSNLCVQGYLHDSHGRVIYETILEFWMMYKLLKNSQTLFHLLELNKKEIIEWFSNQVLFGIGGEKSDILILTQNEEGTRCRAIVIELKKDLIDQNSISQITKYSYWIAQLVTSQITRVANPFIITPVVIGFRKARHLTYSSQYRFQIPYEHPLQVQVEPVITLGYAVSQNDIVLKRI